MAHNDSNLTCVLKILDNFKATGAPNRLSVETPSVATRLNFGDDIEDDSGEYSSVKKRRWASPSQSNTADPVPPAMNSPWETRHLKKDLLDSKAHITSLETRIMQLHALRRELEIVFEAEKNSFLQQQERDRVAIQALESRVAQLRRRESDVRDENVYKIKDLESENYELDKLVQTLRREKLKLADELLEAKRIVRSAESKANDRLAEVEKSKCELEFLLAKERELVRNLSTSKPSESNPQSFHNEKLMLELNEAQRTIKDLEDKIEESREASELAKLQQHKLLRIPEMEQELSTLRSDNAKLRDAVHNKMLMEEEVADLRLKCASSDEREKRLVELEAQLKVLEKELEDWHSLVQDYCPELSTLCATSLRSRIKELQQTELILTAELADLQTKLKSSSHELSKSISQITRLQQETTRMKATQDQQANLIRRWQKKLALITGERNSYREQLDSYEKELTVSAAHHQQASQSRLEALEKSLDGYRELVESLEAELAAAHGQGGSGGLVEKLRKITCERDELREAKEKWQKRCDELELQMEHRALKGDFNPSSTKILHLRMNPATDAESEHEDELKTLRAEVSKLQERVRVLQEGERDDVTCKVNQRLVSSNSEEVQELREQIKSADLMMLRLKEAFKKTSSEFRDCVYQLLGFKVDRLQNKGSMFKLSSMYAESPNDYLLFKMESSGTLTLLETNYSASVEDLIDLHLRQHRSLPMFLAAVTMDLFSRQSMITPSASMDDDEPIVLD